MAERPRTLNMRAQLLAMVGRLLEREYRRNQISANQPSTGGIGAFYVDPNPGYTALHARGFGDWRLKVGGLFERPLSLSIQQLRAMPPRTQITLQSCDEGWSAISEWTGVPLLEVLKLSGVQRAARYVVFR